MGETNNRLDLSGKMDIKLVRQSSLDSMLLCGCSEANHSKGGLIPLQILFDSALDVFL